MRRKAKTPYQEGGLTADFVRDVRDGTLAVLQNKRTAGTRMKVMTDDEVRAFLTDNSWSTGIRIDESGDLFYDSPEANCITMGYPKTPLKVTYFARLVSMLGNYGNESHFAGALLWLRLWNIGSPQLEMSGWRIVERMRMGYGDLRPLGTADGHWFRSDQIADLAAFVVPCFVYGWDAYIIPARGDYFAFISHDEYWCAVSRSPEMHTQFMQDLRDLEPRVDISRKERFCRPVAV